MTYFDEGPDDGLRDDERREDWALAHEDYQDQLAEIMATNPELLEDPFLPRIGDWVRRADSAPGLMHAGLVVDERMDHRMVKVNWSPRRGSGPWVTWEQTDQLEPEVLIGGYYAAI